MRITKFTTVNGDMLACLECLTPTDHILTANFLSPDRFHLKETKKEEDVVLTAYIFNDKAEQLVAEVKRNAMDVNLGFSPVHLHFGTLIKSTELLPDIRGVKFIIVGESGPIQFIASEPFFPPIVKPKVRDGN